VPTVRLYGVCTFVIRLRKSSVTEGYSVESRVDGVLETVDVVHIKDRHCLNLYSNRISPEYKSELTPPHLVRSDKE